MAVYKAEFLITVDSTNNEIAINELFDRFALINTSDLNIFWDDVDWKEVKN